MVLAFAITLSIWTSHGNPTRCHAERFVIDLSRVAIYREPKNCTVTAKRHGLKESK